MTSAVIVVDASVFVDVLLVPSRGRQVIELVGDAAVAAPAHVDAEIASALARLHRNGDLSDDQITPRLAAVEKLAVQRHPVAPLLTEAWRLRNNVSMLDALYVVLTERLGTSLLTTDGRLARASHRARRVRWVSN